ncbi:MAG: DUF4954 family protein [Bacteroidales bacterium]|nr:DUF4954 family protein [Bacteroidales bacterium]
MKTMEYRTLTEAERAVLQAQNCTAVDWNDVLVCDDFSPEYVRYTRFSGTVRLGSFSKEFELPGGMKKHSGLYHATLHNVTVGNDCCIENVKNYIANYRIGDDVFIENVDIILTDGVSSFGNGVEVSVLNETGGREVMIYDRLTAQIAYVMALYRHRPKMIARIQNMIESYVSSVSSGTGTIGNHVTIVDAGYIKNVKVGDYCKIEGASRLKNGTINSCAEAPVHIGINVIGDDFIISTGSSVEDGVTFTRCFIGQACRLGHNYSASDSLFFSNCQGENGEACAIFAGPFTVTHHKSTLLIAGMFSFMNAGSGSNQSNHMYKLGPIHQGILERGAKTTSDSYLLWPAKVGAFSLVMGRHVSHQDTSDLPFSYLIEDQSTSYIVPGANLKSVGTIRDAQKWPRRDARKDPDRLDCINYNLLSPYTIQKMVKGSMILKELQRISGISSEIYTFQSGKIRNSSLRNGLKLYGMAIDKFLGNSLITRIMNSEFSSLQELRERLLPQSKYGDGDWVDISGMIVPKKAVTDIMDDVENDRITDLKSFDERFRILHAEYYEYEWRWAYDMIREHYGISLADAELDDLRNLVMRWKESVVALDNMLYEDARKEFSLTMMTSFGADGDDRQRKQDFVQVRGAKFDNDPFVLSVKEHIRVKSELHDKALARLDVQ